MTGPKAVMMTESTKIAWQRIIRSPYQTMAAVSIMTMTLFLASAFFLIAAGSQAVLRYFETRPQINAYYSSDYLPTPAQIESAKEQLSATGKMASFKYISKEDALVIYKQMNQDDPLLVEAVTAQMLPASLEVTANRPADLDPLAQLLTAQPEIEDVRYAKDVVSSLSRWTNSVRLFGAVFVSIHILITLVIVLLIISIKVSNRREEILILQLVGAKPGYISAPFIWEGIIYGLIGAVIAWIIVYLIILLSQGFLAGFLTGIPILPVSVLFMFSVLAGEIVIGALVGILGGFMASRRFLKA